MALNLLVMANKRLELKLPPDLYNRWQTIASKLGPGTKGAAVLAHLLAAYDADRDTLKTIQEAQLRERAWYLRCKKMERVIMAVHAELAAVDWLEMAPVIDDLVTQKVWPPSTADTQDETSGL